MNLIERYAAEVGKNLGERNRRDIEKEIRSTLEDMLEELKQKEGKADDETVMKLLKEYGSPKKVAATYRKKQYLIGPGLYPVFVTITRIVMIVLFSVSVFGFGISLLTADLSGMKILEEGLKRLGGLFSALTAALGNIVIVFAVIDRTKWAKEFEEEYKKETDDWDPVQLTYAGDPSKTNASDFIATLIFTVLGLVILNLYPDLIAINSLRNGSWTSVPVMTETFFNFIPWINVMGFTQIVFSSFMLMQKKWKNLLRIFFMIIETAGAVLSVVILTTPGIFAITPETWNASGLEEAGKIVSKIFIYVPKFLIFAIIIGTVVKVVQTLIDLLKDGLAQSVKKC